MMFIIELITLKLKIIGMDMYMLKIVSMGRSIDKIFLLEKGTKYGLCDFRFVLKK